MLSTVVMCKGIWNISAGKCSSAVRLIVNTKVLYIGREGGQGD